ncbi:MAG: cobalamin-dependent protein [bacterium]
MNISFVYYGRYQVRESLELEYLSAIAKRAGHNVTLVYDPGVFGVTDNVCYMPYLSKLFSRRLKVIEKIKRSQPDLILFSVYPSSYKWALDIADAVKIDIQVPMVFIGLHAVLVPEKIMQNKSVDFVIQGETEAVFLELIDMISGSISLNNVGNLWYKDKGKVCMNSLKPLIDLDNLPLPDKSLFKEYIDVSDSYMIMASRGCMYACSYCEETALRDVYGINIYRKRTVESVINELTLMKKAYNFKEVLFKDAFFTQDIQWLKDFMREYKAFVQVPFKCFGKIQFVNEEKVKLLKDAGCYCVEFGLQSWNEDIRKKILNRFETNEQARRVFQLCDTCRLWYDIDHIFGLPKESISDHIIAAGEYARLTYLNRVKCHNLMYYPKMNILSHAKADGIVTEEYINQLDEGAEADFFNTTRDTPRMQKINKDFRNLFKIINILPACAVRFILHTKLYLLFRFIPGILIVCAQIVGAWRSHDLRFKVYLKQYPLKIIRTFKS